MEGTRTIVRDPETFRRDLLDLGDAQLLGYAGLAAQAIRKVPTRIRFPEADDVATDAPLETTVTEFGDFRGIGVRGRLPGGFELDAFYGLEREILRNLPDEDPTTAADARRAWLDRSSALTQALGHSWISPRGPRTFDAFGDDGTLLSVRFA